MLKSFFARFPLAPLVAPWSSTFGLGRSFVGLCTLVSLILHRADDLFMLTGVRKTDVLPLNSLARFSLFALVPVDALLWAQLGAIAVLVGVVVGWRAKWLAIPHWYVATSFAVSCSIVDGGDQLAANLSLLLIPICLVDSRRWHWSDEATVDATLPIDVRGWIAHVFAMLVRLQICVVYLHAAAGKLAVTEWVDGTAAYYWFEHPAFGLSDSMSFLLRDVISHPSVVMGVTWGSILLELALAAAIMRPWGRLRQSLFVLGIVFHLTIVFVHGLGSFFFVMAGALVLYLLPLSEPSFVVAWIRQLAARRPSAAEAQAPSSLATQLGFDAESSASTATT